MNFFAIASERYLFDYGKVQNDAPNSSWTWTFVQENGCGLVVPSSESGFAEISTNVLIARLSPLLFVQIADSCEDRQRKEDVDQVPIEADSVGVGFTAKRADAKIRTSVDVT